MKLIQSLNATHKQAISVNKQYNVRHKTSFSALVDALQLEGLLTPRERVSLVEGHLWGDNRAKNGIMLITDKHPLLLSSKEYKIVASGLPQTLKHFESVLRQHATILDENVRPEELDVNVEYHDHLNPKIWKQDENSYTLKPSVKRALEKIADDFIDSLNLPELEIEDIILTGSSANYNWTDHSDVDLHVEIDVNKGEKIYGKLFKDYLIARGTIWNHNHDVSIAGLDVEVYFHDISERHTSTGVYSLQTRQWITEPTHKEPDVDDTAVRRKLASVMNEIDEVVRHCNKAASVERVIEKLKTMRQTGLDKSGEFSVENVVFKALRNNGYLEKLFNCRDNAYDRALSIEEEEWWCR